jgi:hypothetical protein
MINEGLNRPANFEGSISAEQEQRRKLSTEERKEFEKNRLKLDVQPQEFPGLITAMYIDSKQLAHAINSLMGSIFCDYYGSKLEINGNNRQLVATLFFSEDSSGTGKYHAIERVINKDNLNTAEGRINALNQFSTYGRRNLYKMTKEADEMLRDIIPSQFINRDTLKIDWSKVMMEGSTQSNGIYQSKVYTKLMIDLNKLLKVMFGRGNKDEEFQYNVNVGNPINPSIDYYGQQKSTIWQLYIMRCNAKTVREMAQSLGLVWGSEIEQGIIVD